MQDMAALIRSLDEDVGEDFKVAGVRADLALLDKGLVQLGLPALPPGYAAFLMLRNGFRWNGITFYGADDIIPDPDPDHEDPVDDGPEVLVPNLLEANRSRREGAPDGALVLGRSGEDVYLFDPAREVFVVADRLTGVVVHRFQAFPDLVTTVIRERL